MLRKKLVSLFIISSFFSVNFINHGATAKVQPSNFFQYIPIVRGIGNNNQAYSQTLGKPQGGRIDDPVWQSAQSPTVQKEFIKAENDVTDACKNNTGSACSNARSNLYDLSVKYKVPPIAEVDKLTTEAQALKNGIKVNPADNGEIAVRVNAADKLLQDCVEAKGLASCSAEVEVVRSIEEETPLYIRPEKTPNTANNPDPANSQTAQTTNTPVYGGEGTGTPKWVMEAGIERLQRKKDLGTATPEDQKELALLQTSLRNYPTSQPTATPANPQTANTDTPPTTTSTDRERQRRIEMGTATEADLATELKNKGSKAAQQIAKDEGEKFSTEWGQKNPGLLANKDGTGIEQSTLDARQTKIDNTATQQNIEAARGIKEKGLTDEINNQAAKDAKTIADAKALSNKTNVNRSVYLPNSSEEKELQAALARTGKEYPTVRDDYAHQSDAPAKASKDDSRKTEFDGDSDKPATISLNKKDKKQGERIELAKDVDGFYGEEGAGGSFAADKFTKDQKYSLGKAGTKDTKFPTSLPSGTFEEAQALADQLGANIPTTGNIVIPNPLTGALVSVPAEMATCLFSGGANCVGDAVKGLVKDYAGKIFGQVFGTDMLGQVANGAVTGGVSGALNGDILGGVQNGAMGGLTGSLQDQVGGALNGLTANAEVLSVAQQASTAAFGCMTQGQCNPTDMVKNAAGGVVTNAVNSGVSGLANTGRQVVGSENIGTVRGTPDQVLAWANGGERPKGSTKGMTGTAIR